MLVFVSTGIHIFKQVIAVLVNYRVPTDLLDSKYSTFIAPLIDQI